MKLDPVLLDILVCPACKGTLTVDNDHDELLCNGCGLIFPVRDDIPVMLVDEARRPERGQVGHGDEVVEQTADEPVTSTGVASSGAGVADDG